MHVKVLNGVAVNFVIQLCRPSDALDGKGQTPNVAHERDTFALAQVVELDGMARMATMAPMMRERRVRCGRVAGFSLSGVTVGFMNLARNIGGSVGISFVTTMAVPALKPPCEALQHR